VVSLVLPHHFSYKPLLQMVSKSYCFTINGAEPFPFDDQTMQYLVYQKESGEEKKTEHYQGYVRFTSNKRLTGCKKIHSTAHWEIAKGSPEQNKVYCTKEETRIDGPWEFGTFPVQGKRSDLDSVVETIRNSKRPLADVIEEHPVQFIKYSRGIEKVANYYLEKATREFRNITVDVYWGDTGTGKTRKAVEENPDNYILRNLSKDLWFDGYTGQSVLIIDEFKNWITLTYLLALLDGYQCQLPVKGSMTYAQWTKVIITSNLPVDGWYPNIADEHKEALERRITNKTHFTKFF